MGPSFNEDGLLYTQVELSHGLLNMMLLFRSPWLSAAFVSFIIAH